MIKPLQKPFFALFSHRMSGFVAEHKLPILILLGSQIALGLTIWIHFQLAERRSARRLRRAVGQCLDYAETLHREIEKFITIYGTDLNRVRIYVPGRASDVFKEIVNLRDGLAARLEDGGELIAQQSYDKALTLLHSPLSVRLGSSDKIRSGALYPEVSIAEAKTLFVRRADDLTQLLTKRVRHA